MTKCQNRRGYECVTFRSKNVYYKTGNANDLAKKLGISITWAERLIRNKQNRRIAVDGNGNTLGLNIKENFTGKDGLLFKKFGVKRISNKQVAALSTYITTKDIEIKRRIDDPDEEVKFRIILWGYYKFFSDLTAPDHAVSTGSKNSFQLAITKGDRVNRTINVYDEDGNFKLLPNGRVEFSEGKKKREYARIKIYDGEYFGTIPDVENFIIEKINEKADEFNNAELIKVSKEVYDSFEKAKLKLDKSSLRDSENVFKLSEWGNIDYDENYKGNENCIVRIVSKQYPKLYHSIKNLVKKSGIILKDFMYFCKENKIGYSIFNEMGKELYNFDSTEGRLTLIIYNNHGYLLTGGKPRKKEINKLQIKYTDNAYHIFRKYLSKKILPSNIKISYVNSNEKFYEGRKIPVNMISFRVGEKKYIESPDYIFCLDILKKIQKEENIKIDDVEKYMYEEIKIDSLIDVLEKILKVENSESFFPEKNNFKTTPLYYKTNKEIDLDKVVTIDKNKCYAYSLSSLNYLLKFDYRKNKIIENPKKIVETNMYMAKPKMWSILMPETKLYPGYFLKICKEKGLKFKLLEELECEYISNHYKLIIPILYKYLDGPIFKGIVNKYIGKLERNNKKSYVYKYEGVFTDEASKAQTGYKVKVGEYDLLFSESEKYLYAQDRIPIATQIKDQSRLLLYQKIKDLNLKDDDIIQINTDSISYYGKLPKYLSNKGLDGWKESKFIEVSSVCSYSNEDKSCIKIINKNDKERILYNQYAGCGKTTFILEELVPGIEEMGNTCIVLTPTHKTLSEIKRYNKEYGKKIRCEIMQKYTFSETIPEEDYIIIDEIGFIDKSCHNLLFNISEANKSYICFGDFNQLLPSKEEVPYNQQHYLNYMFENINTEFVNYRNNFTKDYYNKLINSKVNLIKEVRRLSTKKPEDAEKILCYRKDTRDEYNSIMLEKNRHETWKEPGVPIICINNNFIKKYEIYNNQNFIIHKERKDGSFRIKDEFDIFYDIPKRRFTKSNFIPNYAINIHQAQGSTLKSYYWAKEDNHFVSDSGRTAYTIISRLRQEK